MRGIDSRAAGHHSRLAVLRSLRRICVVICLATLVHCGAPSQIASESAPVGEQQVFYHDMIVAYESGELAEARGLAKGHIGRLEQRMVNPPHEIERSSIVHGTLGVLRSMLDAENGLPVSNRLGADTDLVAQLDKVLGNAKAMRATLGTTRADMLDYFDREMGVVAASWIAAKRALVSAEQLEETFAQFSEELNGAGFRTVGEVLAKSVSAGVSEEPRAIDVTSREQRQIEKTIGDYFQGLVDNDLPRIQTATELSTSATTTLLAAFAADCQQEGVSIVHSVTVPPMVEQGMELRPDSRGGRAVSTVVRGLELDVTMIDNSRKTMKIDKFLRLRPGRAGRWVIDTPND
jgi:hypothetical protein